MNDKEKLKVLAFMIIEFKYFTYSNFKPNVITFNLNNMISNQLLRIATFAAKNKFSLLVENKNSIEITFKKEEE
jgi:hypothetical protein